jgi:Dyp-type peroxidase family
MPLTPDLSEELIAPGMPFLDDLQGNILKGHGRDHTVSVFFHFKPGQQAKAKSWLASFTKRFVPSASKQLADTKLYKEQGLPGGLFTNLFLTHACYTYLGIADAKIPADAKFRAGMAASNNDPAAPFSPDVQMPLNDPPVATWEKGFDGLIHVMVLIADDNPYFVRAMKRAVILSLNGIAVIMKEQAGRALHNDDGNGIEHNGYADGVSQPLFFAADVQAEVTHGIKHDHWQPQAPLNLALVRDKGGKLPDSCGSYLVFRKLEQNVKGFKDKEEQLARAVFGPNPTPDQRELAGAMVVGRHENGTPLALNRDAQPIGKDQIPNDYTFENPFADGDDTHGGTRCPFHAHTRKNNPRTDGFGNPPLDDNKAHRIVRRGIPYEDKPRKRVAKGLLDDTVQPTGDVGLLFMCFQSDIFQQFEFIQRVWANNEDFEHDQVGIGPIVGMGAPGVPPVPQQWPVTYGDPNTRRVPFRFNDVVKMKGGAYFFAPSLSFLKGLSTATVLPTSLQIFDKLDAFLI